MVSPVCSRLVKVSHASSSSCPVSELLSAPLVLLSFLVVQFSFFALDKRLGSRLPVFPVHVRRLAASPLAAARSVTRAEAKSSMFASALFLSLAGGR